MPGYDPTSGYNPDEQYDDIMGATGDPLAMRGYDPPDTSIPPSPQYGADDYTNAIAPQQQAPMLPFDQPKSRSEKILDLLDGMTEFASNLAHDPYTAEVARTRMEKRSQQAQLARVGVMKVQEEAAKREQAKQLQAQKLFVSLAKGPKSTPYALALSQAMMQGEQNPHVYSTIMEQYRAAAQEDDVARIQAETKARTSAEDEVKNDPERVARELEQKKAEIAATEKAKLEAENTPEAIAARTAEETRKSSIVEGREKRLIAERNKVSDENKGGAPANDPALNQFKTRVENMRKPGKGGPATTAFDSKTGEWSSTSAGETPEAATKREADRVAYVERTAAEWARGGTLTPGRAVAAIEELPPERRKSVAGLISDAAEKMIKSGDKRKQAQAEALLDALEPYAPQRPGG